MRLRNKLVSIICTNQNCNTSIGSLSLSLPFFFQLLPALAVLVNHSDKEVVSDACWALSYLTDGSVERIQAVLDSGAAQRLVELLGSDEITCVVGQVIALHGKK